MKNRKSVLIIGLILLVIAGLVTLILSGGTAAAVCKPDPGVIPVHYTITIQDNKPSNTTLSTVRCDTVTFMNEDNVSREIAFGTHEKHVAYDGIKERVLNQGESFTVTMIKTGNSFQWHDHWHDVIQGTFSVAP